MHPNKANDRSRSPWAARTWRPIAEQQSAWLHQGTAVGQTPARQPRSKQIIGIAVLAVVVLGLAGATVACFLTSGPGRTGNPQLAALQPAGPLVAEALQGMAVMASAPDAGSATYRVLAVQQSHPLDGHRRAYRGQASDHALADLALYSGPRPGERPSRRSRS